MKRTLFLIVLAAACGKKSEDPPAKDKDPPPPPPPVAKAPDAAATTVVVENQGKVELRFSPPAGWAEQTTGGSFYYQAPGSASKLTIDLTCLGSCGDEAKARENVAAKASEAKAEVAEEAPGRFYSRVDAGGVTTFSVDRLLPPLPDGTVRILSCNATVAEPEAPLVASLEALCRGLEHRVL